VLQYFVVSKYCIEFHPRTGHEGPEEGREVSFTLSLTSALDGGGWLTPALALSSQVKVKFSRYRPGVAQRVGRGIALLFRDRGTRRG